MWVHSNMKKSIILGLSLLTAGSVSGGPELPPHIRDIESRGWSCVAQSVEHITVDAQTHLVVSDEFTYEARVKVKYGELHPEYRKLLSVRDSMKDAAMDCVEWSETLQREMKKAK